MSSVSKEFFAKAASEVASGQLDNALYIKSLALSQGDEVKARALYISMRAEELQRNHRCSERIDTTSHVVGAAGGLAPLLIKVFLSICSFILPGAGQLFSRRYRDSLKFFAPIAVYWILLYLLHPFVDLSTIPSNVTLVFGALFILFQLWAAIDTYLNFGKRSASASSRLPVAKEHAA